MIARYLGICVLAATLGSNSALALDKVTLRLNWIFGSEFAPIFLARDKGFFEKEGIDVDIQPGQGSTVTVKLVGNGDSEFGKQPRIKH